jgi:hypothetical protein
MCVIVACAALQFNDLGGNCGASETAAFWERRFSSGMSIRLLALGVVIVGFGGLTAAALLDVGYWGIIEPHFKSWGAAQVLTDLVILALLSCIWMVRDAKEKGLPAWPFVAITLAAGSFGTLFYLVFRELRTAAGKTTS